MFPELKRRVFEANMALRDHGLIVLTWGNVSECDRARGIFAIKPSGVAYDALKVEDIVIVDFDGDVVEGSLQPSSDVLTHAVLYNHFTNIGGITHTHSRYAVIWAQTGRDIPAYGTTHADFSYGPVPCTRGLTDEEIADFYEIETGQVITSLFDSETIDPTGIPAVLVRSHGPFTWGKDARESVNNAVTLEEVAMMALCTETLSNGPVSPVSNKLLNKHFLRKHGSEAYYGQTR